MWRNSAVNFCKSSEVTVLSIYQNQCFPSLLWGIFKKKKKTNKFKFYFSILYSIFKILPPNWTIYKPNECRNKQQLWVYTANTLLSGVNCNIENSPSKNLQKKLTVMNKIEKKILIKNTWVYTISENVLVLNDSPWFCRILMPNRTQSIFFFFNKSIYWKKI